MSHSYVWIVESQYKRGQSWLPYSVFGRCFYTKRDAKGFMEGVVAAWCRDHESAAVKFRIRRYERTGDKP